MKKIIIISILLSSITFAFVDCSPFAPEKDKEKCDYPLRPNTGEIGETIRSCHFEVTFNWAQKTEVYGIATPYRQDFILVVFQVKVTLVKFIGVPLIDCNCFYVVDGQGNAHEWGGNGWNYDSLGYVPLNQGQTAEGVVIINVPKSASNLRVLFYPPIDPNYKDKIYCHLGF